MLIVTFLAPESPWWLVRHGHYERAEQSLKRLTAGSSSGEVIDVTNTISMMRVTIEEEKEVSPRVSMSAKLPAYEIHRLESDLAISTVSGELSFAAQRSFVWSGLCRISAGLRSCRILPTSLNKQA